MARFVQLTVKGQKVALDFTKVAFLAEHEDGCGEIVFENDSVVKVDQPYADVLMIANDAFPLP